jgi:hypothetical protein
MPLGRSAYDNNNNNNNISTCFSCGTTYLDFTTGRELTTRVSDEETSEVSDGLLAMFSRVYSHFTASPSGG